MQRLLGLPYKAVTLFCFLAFCVALIFFVQPEFSSLTHSVGFDSLSQSIQRDAPVITVQPNDAKVPQGSTHAISVVVDIDAVDYQWMKNDMDDIVGASPIVGANSDTLQIDTTSLGTSFYFVMVTNVAEETTISDVVEIRVVTALSNIDTVMPENFWWMVLLMSSAGIVVGALVLAYNRKS